MNECWFLSIFLYLLRLSNSVLSVNIVGYINKFANLFFFPNTIVYHLINIKYYPWEFYIFSTYLVKSAVYFTLTTHLNLEKLYFKCSLAMCGYHIEYHMSNALYVITTMKRTSTRLQRFVMWQILLLILPCISFFFFPHTHCILFLQEINRLTPSIVHGWPQQKQQCLQLPNMKHTHTMS